MIAITIAIAIPIFSQNFLYPARTKTKSLGMSLNHRRRQGGHGGHDSPPIHPGQNHKIKDLGRAGAKESQEVWSPNRHAWPPNQKAYSFENNGFCA